MKDLSSVAIDPELSTPQRGRRSYRESCRDARFDSEEDI